MSPNKEHSLRNANELPPPLSLSVACSAQLAAAAEQQEGRGMGQGKRRKDSERPPIRTRPSAAKRPRVGVFARILSLGWRESIIRDKPPYSDTSSYSSGLPSSTTPFRASSLNERTISRNLDRRAQGIKDEERISIKDMERIYSRPVKRAHFFGTKFLLRWNFTL